MRAVQKLETPPIPREVLLRLYREMVRLRTLDERMMTLQRQGRVGFYGACTGQEAATLASAIALEASDWIFPALREGGAMLLRGFPLVPYLCQIFGNAGDETKGRQMPSHMASRSVNQVSWSSCIGTQLPQAVGAAMAARIKGDRTLVECETDRVGAHSSSDDPTRYRDEEEVEEWKKRDPLELLRSRLQGWGLWTARQEDERRAQVLEEVNDAIAEAEKKPDPARESLFDDVYANQPWSLREQREELLASPPAARAKQSP